MEERSHAEFQALSQERGNVIARSAAGKKNRLAQQVAFKKVATLRAL
jgi:hypothetical protein